MAIDNIQKAILMLEIKNIRLKNFWSYGDYDTKLNLNNLGPCLITGEVVDHADVDPKKTSNGAGKSAIIEAMLWCLFGRTMRIPNPGNKVVNFFTNKDCLVEIEFCNGDVLRRTRNLSGHNDLLLIKDGEDISLGTTTMEQQRLNNLLGLDWDIFCGSTFFSQFGKSWMEISDTKRKEALEREFHLDKIKLYASAAKSRLDIAKSEQEKLKWEADGIQGDIDRHTEEITSFSTASKQFDQIKQGKISSVLSRISDIQAQITNIPDVDIEKLEQHWRTWEEISRKIDMQRDKVKDLQWVANNISRDIQNNQALINKWQGKKSVCSACEQPISARHVASKIATPQQKITALQAQAEENRKATERKKASILLVAEAANKKKPTMSLVEAKNLLSKKTQLQKQITQEQKLIEQISSEQNHYDDTINTLKTKLGALKKSLSTINNKIAKFDTIILHINYIYRAYHDRRKIKSYMLSEYIPYLNNRIAYYLEKFKLDLKIEFTNALGIKNEYWGYESFSGGECKRFDVAMMLAIFDLHTLMYGRHCNLLVFDEVDGRLDVVGAEILADIIRSDFADKVDTILVISQRTDMRSAMPSEIKIIREDRFSRISEILK